MYLENSSFIVECTDMFNFLAMGGHGIQGQALVVQGRIFAIYRRK